MHTITQKDPHKRIWLITVANPINGRTESADILKNLETLIGTITSTVYIIYDIRQASISFTDLVAGVASGFARPRSEFETHLTKHGRTILVGTGTIVEVGAKTMARFAPTTSFPVFHTPEEGVAYAEAELAKQQS